MARRSLNFLRVQLQQTTTGFGIQLSLHQNACLVHLHLSCDLAPVCSSAHYLLQYCSFQGTIFRDRAPMVQRTLLNLLRLLLGTEHRWCEDPIESAPFIRDQAPMVRGPYCICVVYYYYSFPNLIAFLRA